MINKDNLYNLNGESQLYKFGQIKFFALLLLDKSHFNTTLFAHLLLILIFQLPKVDEDQNKSDDDNRYDVVIDFESEMCCRTNSKTMNQT